MPPAGVATATDVGASTTRRPRTVPVPAAQPPGSLLKADRFPYRETSVFEKHLIASSALGHWSEDPDQDADHVGRSLDTRTAPSRTARFPVLFPVMGRSTPEPAASTVRRQVEHARPGTFFRRRDFPGGDRAVESALSRLAANGELLRVRKGLYWRGKRTRFGMTRPSTLEIALAVGGPGAGPCGVAAAHLLGLTTQVPATVEVAVPGRVPDPMPGVRFRSRPYARREQRLTPAEVAVLELLRDPHAAEAAWPRVVDRIRVLIADGSVRTAALHVAATEEPRIQARERWATVATSRSIPVDDPDGAAVLAATVSTGSPWR